MIGRVTPMPTVFRAWPGLRRCRSKAHKRFACLKPLRNALHQFAWQSTLQEGWARD